MRINTLIVVTIAQLVSLASAVPVSNQPVSPLAERAVLLPRYRHRCNNYPGVILGLNVAKREVSTESASLESRSLTGEDSKLEPRHHKHPRVHWCWQHSDMWLSIPKGTRRINETTVLTLFQKALQYTTSYIGNDPQNTLFNSLRDTPIFLGSVYPSPENKDSMTESMYAVGDTLTWKTLDTAVRMLQNYVYVRHAHTNQNATIYDARKVVGQLYFGGPLLPDGYFLPDSTYPISDHL